MILTPGIQSSFAASVKHCRTKQTEGSFERN